MTSASSLARTPPSLPSRFTTAAALPLAPAAVTAAGQDEDDPDRQRGDKSLIGKRKASRATRSDSSSSSDSSDSSDSSGESSDSDDDDVSDDNDDDRRRKSRGKEKRKHKKRDQDKRKDKKRERKREKREAERHHKKAKKEGKEHRERVHQPITIEAGLVGDVDVAALRQQRLLREQQERGRQAALLQVPVWYVDVM